MSNIIHLFARRSEKEEKSPVVKDLLDEGCQLTLPFDAPHVLYLLTSDADIVSEDFYSFLIQKEIAAFFDLRFSPRLDFIASTRQRAFVKLKDLNISYVDVFGRAGASSLDAALEDCIEILKEIVLATENTLKHGEPCLMIFDSQSLARTYEKAMGKYFDVHEISGKFIQEVAAESVRLQK